MAMNRGGKRLSKRLGQDLTPAGVAGRARMSTSRTNSSDPFCLPNDWSRKWAEKVHRPMDEEVLDAIRRSNATGLPYGDESWGKRAYPNGWVRT